MFHKLMRLVFLPSFFSAILSTWTSPVLSHIPLRLYVGGLAITSSFFVILRDEAGQNPPPAQDCRYGCGRKTLCPPGPKGALFRGRSRGDIHPTGDQPRDPDHYMQAGQSPFLPVRQLRLSRKLSPLRGRS